MREIKNIIIHCSASKDGKPFTVRDCDSWHIERGFRRKDEWREQFNPGLFAIGYHYWINIDGAVQTGRHLDEVGAHVSGMNAKSIGICMCGNGKFTKTQWAMLKVLVMDLKNKYPAANILGHYQCPTGITQGKLCPEFDVTSWQADMMPDDKHVLA